MDDKQIWDNFTKTVKPLKKNNVVSSNIGSKPTKSAPKRQEEKGVRNRDSDGDFIADARIDLHGYTLQQAFEKIGPFIAHCYQFGRRNILVITGHGEGDTSIRREFPIWMQKYERYVQSLKEADQRHGGKGAWYLILKKSMRS